jgi:hypothetical protein
MCQNHILGADWLGELGVNVTCPPLRSCVIQQNSNTRVHCILCENTDRSCIIEIDGLSIILAWRLSILRVRGSIGREESALRTCAKGTKRDGDGPWGFLRMISRNGAAIMSSFSGGQELEVNGYKKMSKHLQTWWRDVGDEKKCTNMDACDHIESGSAPDRI